MQIVRIVVFAVTFFLALSPAFAQVESGQGTTIVITTDIAEAEVWLDGVMVGLSPAKVVDVAPGLHVAEVRARGRAGKRRFEMREMDRRIYVPLENYENPMSVGLEGTLGFRGSNALLGGGLAFSYHVPQHELGLAVDWFDLRGRQDLLFQGVLARIEYAWVPFTLAGGGSSLIMPLKARGRISVAQTTSLISRENGHDEGSVAGLGLGAGIAAEIQMKHFGIEPGFYYDWYATREVSVGQTNLRPPLDNGGFNLRLKFYF